MKNGNTQNLAEKIALLLQEESPAGDDLGLLRAGLAKINERLDRLEAQIAFQRPQTEHANPQYNHPSQERFTNLEELADEIIKNLQNEKPCPYEPTAKPCDHCSMCSSRGF